MDELKVGDGFTAYTINTGETKASEQITFFQINKIEGHLIHIENICTVEYIYNVLTSEAFTNDETYGLYVEGAKPVFTLRMIEDSHTASKEEMIILFPSAYPKAVEKPRSQAHAVELQIKSYFDKGSVLDYMKSRDFMEFLTGNQLDYDTPTVSSHCGYDKSADNTLLVIYYEDKSVFVVSDHNYSSRG